MRFQKPILHSKWKVEGLCERGFCNFRTADRLFEPGSEDAFNAYVSECERREVESIGREIAQCHEQLSREFQQIGLGKRVVENICKDSHGQEHARRQLQEVQQFFKDYGLTSQANEAWKNYWA